MLDDMIQGSPLFLILFNLIQDFVSKELADPDITAVHGILA